MPKFSTTIGVTIVDNVSMGICHYFGIKNKNFIFHVLEIIFSEGSASNSFGIWFHFIFHQK
jgi:hypothetical protein